MGYSNGKITEPVSVDDVRSALNESSYDVKTLCMSEKINKAAIFRPRFMGGAVHVNPEDFQTKLSQLAPPPSGASGIDMKCVNYGIWVPYFDNLGNGRPWNASHVRWNARPCDETQFGDLTHFIGYDRYARFTNPVESVVCVNGSKIQVTFKDSFVDGSISAASLFRDNEDAQFGFIVYEYTGDGPVLSGTNAVTPRSFLCDFSVASTTGIARTVTSDFNATKGKSYDIIPIVAVVKNNNAWEYYTLFISDSVPGFIKKYIGNNDIEFVYCRFAEGTFYPDGEYVETGSSIGVGNQTFAFALMMSSQFPQILATSDTAYATGLIRPSSIKVTAKFTRQSDKEVFTKVFTPETGLVVKQQLNTNILRMYIGFDGSNSLVYKWADQVAGTRAGDFDFDVSFTINTNTSGGSEQCSYPAQSWMLG